MPRYPYDRNSKPFLRCLDLGIIPPPEDLPELSQRHYYDGCLIAEINDLRNESLPMSKSPPRNLIRVLLRPDMFSLYQDVEQGTCNLDPSLARAVERNIVKATSHLLNLHPRSKLTSYTQNGAVHTINHAFNIIRKPRRRALRPPSRPPHVPRLSTAALLLISAAEKQQRLHRNMSLSMRAMASELSTVATKQSSYIDFVPNATAFTPSASAARQKPEPLVANGTKAGDLSMGNNNNANKPVQPKTPRPRRFSIPSKKLLQGAKQQLLKSDKAFCPSTYAAAHLQQLGPLAVHERVRTVRDHSKRRRRLGIHTSKRYAGVCQENGRSSLSKSKGKVRCERAKISKLGLPGLLVQILRSLNGSVEVFFVRSHTNDKEHREYFLVDVANVR